MWQWTERVQQWFRWRHMDQKALAVVQRGQGVGVRTWPLTIPLAPAAQQAIRAEVRMWLTEQLAAAASPYGWSRCTIIIGLARKDGTVRTPLWKTLLPGWSKEQMEPCRAAVDEQLAALPLVDHPTATQLEVYLMDMGTILREAVPE